jgi:hypothetical protein
MGALRAPITPQRGWRFAHDVWGLWNEKKIFIIYFALSYMIARESNHKIIMIKTALSGQLQSNSIIIAHTATIE